MNELDEFVFEGWRAKTALPKSEQVFVKKYWEKFMGQVRVGVNVPDEDVVAIFGAFIAGFSAGMLSSLEQRGVKGL